MARCLGLVVGALAPALGCVGVPQPVEWGSADGASGPVEPPQPDDVSGPDAGGSSRPSTDTSAGDSSTGDSSTGDSSTGESSTGESSTGANLLGPPYPVVLAHGFFGFEDFAGADFATYFFDVQRDLEAAGEPMVFTPAVDPFNDSTTRGLQLLAHVQSVLAETGHERVNLIGHSQGGLDARVVASLRPDLVASVTTFSTPHGGAPAADVVLGLVADPNQADVADELVRLFGAPLWSELGDGSSVSTALAQLSTPAMVEFNSLYLDAAGVYYQSFAGRSALRDGGAPCHDDVDAPAYVLAYEDARDPLALSLTMTGAISRGGRLVPEPHDGLVRVKDARWGRFRGCVPADHLDEVGQLLGDSPGLGNPWRHREFYREVVAELRGLGF